MRGGSFFPPRPLLPRRRPGRARGRARGGGLRGGGAVAAPRAGERGGSVAGRAAGEAPATGTGRRGIGGAHYEASPPSGRRDVPGVQRTGAATRKISGGDIKGGAPP